MSILQGLLMLVQLLLIIKLTKTNGDMENFLYKKQKLQNASVILYPQRKGSRIDKKQYNDNRPSPHNTIYLINQETLCSQHKEVFLLVAIRTIYSHSERRNVLRKALQFKRTFRLNFDIVIKYAFLFGKTNNAATEKLIRTESNSYKDIIQEDFIESYSNLTYKTVMAWKWSVEYCPNTQYVMVINDELFIDIEKVVLFLLRDLNGGNLDNHFAICYPIGNGVVIHNRMRQFKALDPKIMYHGKYAPLYCHGYGYTAHITVINKLYQASKKCPFFMPDDMWLGVLTEKLRLIMINHRYAYVTNKVEQYFQAKDYLWKPGMFAVCDGGKYRGHASKSQQRILSLVQAKHNIISAMQKKFLQGKEIFLQPEKNHLQSKEKQMSRKQILIILSIILILIIYKYLPKFLSRIFNKFYRRI